MAGGVEGIGFAWDGSGGGESGVSGERRGLWIVV